jgi:tryptophan 2,3-dioxygenase
MEQSKALTYTSYLALDEVLNAQRPRSDEHDEILFIVVHQVYELWFKQLIHELRYLQRMLEDGNDARAFATFKRLLTILKLVVAQLDVIETMTPVQFLAVRERLESSSGFQSGQFRDQLRRLFVALRRGSTQHGRELGIKRRATRKIDREVACCENHAPRGSRIPR